jgi:hypothetical protein
MSAAFDALPDAEQGEIAERISEALWGHYSSPPVTVPGVILDDVEMLDVTNHRITGTVDETPFCCDSGDRSGFVMLAWGDELAPEVKP